MLEKHTTEALEIKILGYVNAQLTFLQRMNEGKWINWFEWTAFREYKSRYAKYDVLKEQKDDCFRRRCLVLEDALKVNPEINQGILEQLKNIYVP